MILCTSDEIPGRRVAQVFGLVRGNTVRGHHVGRDILAGLRNLVGGEITEYTKLVAEAREQALHRMTVEARARGADAIVAVRFGTSEVTKGASELFVYGTAVRLEPEG